MKQNRTATYTALSSIALLVVLIIQVNWIIQTAKYKEELFNEKVHIILARTTETLSADTATCKRLQTDLGAKETQTIDSLFKYYMDYYNFHEPYTFEFIRTSTTNPFMSGINGDTTNNQPQQACYDNSLDQLQLKNDWKLNLKFPQKKTFIISEMGLPFMSSVVLIVIVLILFWKTVTSLTKEKKLSEHATDFLNNMTHEFKTPLTNISLAGKMIIKDPIIKQEEKVKHYTGIILEENEKLRLQVEQVLSITALERGEIPLQKTELDFHQLIKDALKSMSIQIENKEGHLNINLEASQWVVMGDRTHLTNALSNLIDNAIKYSMAKPEISIRTYNQDKNIVMEVSDKGIGIEKEYQKKVYEKYFRVPTGNVHDVRGFGLGLAYVKTIIELHGGTIHLESMKDKGTTIIIHLPYD
jgi:two-component system, OmpR family, phosphate regulon sensor histidine kinase PhoR